MKKLMIAIAAVVMAAFAQAASVSWTITGVTENGSLLTKGSQYVFFYDSASAAQTAIATFTDLAGSGADAFNAAMSSANWHDVKKATAAGAFTIGTTAATGSYTLPTNSDLGLTGLTKYYAISVIFDTETITDESNYIIAQGAGATVNGVTLKDDASSQTAAFMFGTQASREWNAVAAVPEPTSGLMLLLGMAGLALRRRRA